MSSSDTELYTQRFREICEAVAAHDVDAVLEHFSDDCVVINGVAGTVDDKSALTRFFQETWAVFPDFAPRPVASHLEGNTLGVLFEATGTPIGPDGVPRPQVRWLGTGFSTFDPVTRKIVRDVYFADDLTGEGHRHREIEGPLVHAWVFLPEDIDPAQWRV